MGDTEDPAVDPVDVPALGGAGTRFVDRLIRPFVIATVSLVCVVQLVERPPERLAAVVWVLVVVAIAAGAVCAVAPWGRFTGGAQLAVVSVFTAAGALVFPLATDTAAAALVYLASATAGEKAPSRRAAYLMAAIGTGLAAVATFGASTWLHLPTASPWWLAATVGLPLFVGMARRDRTDAIAAADLAVRQGRRAAASEAREAALRERGRIAREIHDVLGHSLSGVALQLDMADALHTGGRDEEANQAVRRARALAVSGFGETRRAIHALREDTLPLPETLAELAASGSAAFAVQGEPVPVPVEVAQAVVRTAQEAITNARRHAPGAEVTMLLDYTGERVRLTVADTGSDGPVGGPVGSGMGLVGMRERAGLLGGTLYAGPGEQTGRGWTVRLELPR
ncbi:MAG: histidine kinase [Umezawaea sp.]